MPACRVTRAEMRPRFRTMFDVSKGGRTSTEKSFVRIFEAVLCIARCLRLPRASVLRFNLVRFLFSLSEVDESINEFNRSTLESILRSNSTANPDPTDHTHPLYKSSTLHMERTPVSSTPILGYCGPRSRLHAPRCLGGTNRKTRKCFH